MSPPSCHFDIAIVNNYMLVTILGIKISTLSKKQILNKISEFLNNHNSHTIFTPNPEFLLEARKNEEFFYILNQADLAIPDGFGLVLASLLMGKRLKRISGSDLIYDICALAAKENKSVFLLGGSGNTAEKASEKLKKIYPNLQIVGAEQGLRAGEWEIKSRQWTKGEGANQRLIERINEVKPDIIFVAFGHPKQELWIYHTLKHLPSVKVAMGVGGSFDFIAGTVKRAPRIMRVIGLEWLWRLLQEPRTRWKRIYNAVVKFPLVFLRWRFIK